MLVAADAILGRTNAGKAIGYSVLTLDRETVVAPFTRERVIATGSYKWAVLGSVFVPDAGGVIVWGTEDEPIADEVFNPAPAEVVNAVASRTTDLLNSFFERFVRAIPEPLAPVVQVETAQFEEAVTELRVELTALASQMLTGDSERTQNVTDLQEQVRIAVEHITQLRGLNNAARAIGAIRAIYESLGAVLGAQSPVVQMLQVGNHEHVAQALEAQAKTIAELTQAVQSERPVKDSLRQALTAMDKFTELYGGELNESGNV